MKALVAISADHELGELAGGDGAVEDRLGAPPTIPMRATMVMKTTLTETARPPEPGDFGAVGVLGASGTGRRTAAAPG